jgi:hypothetical protein
MDFYNTIFITKRVYLLIKEVTSNTKPVNETTNIKITMRRLISAVFWILSPSLSFAGGMESMMADDTNVQGPAYFGFVKDEKGHIIKSASVVVTAKSFGNAGVTATFITNVLGVYRGHIHQEAKPEILKLICIKDGYRQIKTLRRSGNNKFLETDCIMQKIQEK